MCDGIYDKQGKLVEGTYTTKDATFKGYFNNGNMYKGTAIYMIKPNKPFTVAYELVYDPSYRQYMLSSCDVTWDGKLADLSYKTLVMVCCNGARDKGVHITFLELLKDIDVASIPYIHMGMFNNLSTSNYAHMRLIINNLKAYPDYVGKGDINPVSDKKKPRHS